MIINHILKLIILSKKLKIFERIFFHMNLNKLEQIIFTPFKPISSSTIIKFLNILKNKL